MEELREFEQIEDKVEITTEDKLEAICEILYENMADDIKILKIDELSPLADYFVVASAKSPNHLRSLTNEVSETMRFNGINAKHVEGLKGLKWSLLDFADIVIHIFLPQAREYYGLEAYWADAPMRKYEYKPDHENSGEENDGATS